MAFKNNSYYGSTPTAPVNENAFEVQEYGATTPVNNSGVGPTGAVESPFEFENSGAPFVENYSDETTPVSVGGVEGFSPVVGWLVCVDGPAEGTDYRIRAGYNYIGRGEHMDICIQGDNNIGRERHAMIAYDPQEKIYFFGPADGRSIVRKNEKMVMVPTELAAYDIVRIGSTKLMFVPLCGEHFNWRDEQYI